MELIFEGNLEAAQRSLNKAVNINPQSSTSHFLNGLVYHLQAKKGASSKLELAKVGYDLALKYDPNNAHAAYYRGILHFENKEYASAQSDFAQAAILRPEDPHILYGLAASAYYMGEFELAAGAIMQVLEKAPNSKRYLHTAALILGAGGDKVKAKTYQEKLSKESHNTRQNKFLERRLKEWEGVHQKALKMASFSSFVSQGLSSSFANIGGSGDGYGGGGNAYGEAGGGEGSGAAMPGAPSSSSSDSSTEEKMRDNMVIVYVVLILTTESWGHNRGMNLLKQLNLTFGNTANTLNPSGFNFTSGRQKGTSFDPTAGVAMPLQNYSSMVTQLTIPMVEYSLNVANSAQDKSEILARPSLLARHGQTSQFFSGSDLTYGYGNENAVGFKDKQVGVFLEVTPFVLPDGRVNIKLDLKRDFFTPIDTAVQNARNGVQTSSTRLASDVIMRVGDTLILGGLSDKVSTYRKEGTSVLQDIPILGFLFSQITENSTYTSVIILVTPRLPQYTYKAFKEKAPSKDHPEDAEMTDRSAAELKARYVDWFKPYNNLGSVFHQLQRNELYKEFRTGDVNLEDWDSPDQVLPEIEDSLDFVY